MNPTQRFKQDMMDVGWPERMFGPEEQLSQAEIDIRDAAYTGWDAALKGQYVPRETLGDQGDTGGREI